MAGIGRRLELDGDSMSDVGSPLTFSAGDANTPPGPAVPSVKEVQAMGVIGLDLRRAGRATLMNQVGDFLHIPRGGWHGQAKLFEGDDIRLRGLLVKMAN